MARLTPVWLQEIEEQYRHVWALEGVEPKFPQHYPKSVLLGCVDLADCLPVILLPQTQPRTELSAPR